MIQCGVALAALSLLEILSLQRRGYSLIFLPTLTEMNCFGALTVRRSSEKSSSSSKRSIFFRVAWTISITFSRCWFSRSRHWLNVQNTVKDKAEHTTHLWGLKDLLQLGLSVCTGGFCRKEPGCSQKLLWCQDIRIHTLSS